MGPEDYEDSSLEQQVVEAPSLTPYGALQTSSEDDRRDAEAAGAKSWLREHSPFRFNKQAFLLTAGATAGVLLIVVASTWILGRNNTDKSAEQLKNYASQSVNTETTKGYDQLLNGGASLQVNGLLQVSQGVTLQPSGAPAKPTKGQLYFDSKTNQPYYYDGTNFVSFAPTTIPTHVSSIGGATGDISVGSGLQITTNGQLSLSPATLQSIASSKSTIVWTDLSGYPVACAPGQAITKLADVPTCTAVLTGAYADANYIKLQNTTPGTAQTGNLNISGTALASLFSGSGSALTNLNASSISSGTVASGRISGNYSGITGLGTLTVGTWNASTITVPYGGTGQTSFTSNGVLYGSGAGALQSTGAGTTGDCLVAQTGAAPIWVDCQTATGGDGVSALNTLDGALTIQGTAGQLAITDNGTDTLTVALDANVSLLGQAIDSSEIADGTITGTDIAAGTVTGGNIASGTITNANLQIGSFTNITGVGVISAGTWQGTSVADAYIDDGLTIDASGSVNWLALNNYPAACPAGQAITQLGDTITCSTFAGGSGSGNYIQNQNSSAQAADFWIDGNATAGFYFGDGSGLTSLDGGNITSGTIANARLTGSGALTITAGSGLINGGSVALGGNTTINVGAGDGISVNADDIAVDGTVCRTSGNCAGAGNGGGATNAGTQNYITKTDGSGNLVNSLLFDDGTGVGIGTTGPGYSLDVQGGTGIVAQFSGRVIGGDAVNSNELVTKSQLDAAASGAAGSGVTSLNALLGALTVQGTAGKVAVSDNGTNTITLDLDSSVTLLGQTIESGEITNGTIQNIDLQAGTFGNITGVGTIVAGTWNADSLTDAYVDNSLTIDAAGSVNWQALNNYPAACSAGEAITALADTPTCSAFLTGSAADGAYIQLQSTTPGTAQTGNLNISGVAIAGSFVGDGSALTGLDAGNVATGLLNNARLNSVVSLLGQSIALGSETTGNYQTFTAAGDGITVTGAVGVGTTPTVAVDGTVCRTSGNCAGAGNGGGATNAGSENYLTKTDNGGNLVDSLVYDDGSGVGIGGVPSYLFDVQGGAGIVAQFSGRVIGGDAVNSNEFVTKSQLDGVTGGSNAVVSLNSLVGGLTVQGTAGKVTVADNGTDTITLDLDSNVTLLGQTIESGEITNGTIQNIDLQAGTFGNITGVGALVAGSINWSGNIATTGTVSGATINGTTINQNGNQVCDTSGNCGYTGDGTGSGVASLNGLSGDVVIQGNSQIAVNASDPNITLSIQADSIGDSQLAYNTGQNLTVTSAPVFAGLIINGNVGIGIAIPLYNLDVSGTANATTLFQNGNQVCDNTGNCAGTGNGGGATNSGQQNFVTKTDANGNLVSSQIYDDGTKISIGSTSPGYDLEVDGTISADALYQGANQVCDVSGNCGYNGAGSGAGVGSVNTLSGDLTIQGNSQILVGNVNSTTIGFSIQADTIGNTQLQYDTGQHLTTTSTPTFGGLIINGDLSISSNVALLKGTDYSVTGTTNNVNFGNGALFRLTGASSQTISGFAGGTDGRIITLINAAAQDATLLNNSGSSVAANRIITGTGGDLIIATGASINLVYDAGSNLWRVVGGTSGIGGGVYVTLQGGTPGTADVGNFNISGTGIANKLQVTAGTGAFDTATSGALNIGTTNATQINLNQNVTIASGKTLTLAGGNTAGRPVSPTEGTLYYDTTTKQLLIYANGKWQADRSESILVAASDSSQADKDAADYVADGNTGAAADGDQVQINQALTAAAGKKVVLLAGTYIIDDSISIPNNTTLAGVGVGTVITIPNSHSSIDAITNSSTGGSGLIIESLVVDGNGVNQSFDFMRGIYLNDISESTIRNVRSQNWNTGSEGISLENSDRNSLLDNIVYDNGGRGINLSSSDYNKITNNASRNNVAGLYLGSSSYNSVIGNVFTNNSDGINIVSSSSNTISSNTIASNGSSGISIVTNSNFNVVSVNNLYDNTLSGSASSILIASSDSNSITDNRITDTAGTGYAINISNAASDATYLADNNYSGTGATSIGDAGTGTIFGGQVNGSNNYVVQPAGTIELLKNTNVTGFVNATTGFKFNGTAGSTTTCTGSQVLTNPVIQGGIVTGGSCSLPTAGNTLQTAYNNSSSPATILLADAKNFVVTAADTATDPSIVMKLNCTGCGTGATGNFQVQNNAGAALISVAGNGTIQIGTASNGISLSGAGGITTGSFTLTGTARNSKKMLLTPEYAGAVLDALSDTTGATPCATNYNGNMTSGYTGDTSPRQSYYNWVSAAATNSCYDVVVQVPIPTDFSAWDGATPWSMLVYNSASTNSTSIYVKAIDTANVTDTAYVGTGGYQAVSSGTTFASANLTAPTGTYTPGGYMTLKIRMFSTTTTNNIRIGNITLNYLSKF